MIFPLHLGLEENNWADFIVAAANAFRARERKNVTWAAQKFPDIKFVRQHGIYEHLLRRLMRYGVTDSLIKDLNDGFGYETPYLRADYGQKYTDDVVLDPDNLAGRNGVTLRGNYAYQTIHVAGISEMVTTGVRFGIQSTEGARQLHVDLIRLPAFLDEEEAEPETGLLFYETFLFACCLEDLQKVRRCQSKDCGNYFIGTKRAKWCSGRCGSRERLRKKRKKDKERQML